MFSIENLVEEFKFKGIRSSGSGGQHVNKVASKIELSFQVLESSVLTETQKKTIVEKLKSRLTKEGLLILQCGESRSQHQNKSLIIKRAVSLLNAALKKDKKRIKTKVPKAVIRKRLKNKRLNSDRKANRRKPDLE